MATNEILQFASTNTGTNLLTQAEYSADAQRTTGNQPGIARSKLVNKALRQSSLLAAGLAEFIADYQANNVTDSLTPQNIADYLLAAITANIPVVPDASTTVKGKIEIATPAEAQSYSSSLLALTPATMFQALQGSNQSLAANGYQRLPGGLLLQWGQVSVYSNGIDGGSSPVTFPVAFPSNCVVTAVKNGGGVSGVDGIYANRGTSLTGFTANVDSATGNEGAGWRTVAWQAIGY